MTIGPIATPYGEKGIFSGRRIVCQIKDTRRTCDHEVLGASGIVRYSDAADRQGPFYGNGKRACTRIKDYLAHFYVG